MSTDPKMPMGMSAARLQLDDPLPDLQLGAGRSPLPLDLPPASPMPLPTQPSAPAIPWSVRLQPDGSSVNYITGPDGKEVIINVNPPPKLPKALQPSTQPLPQGPSPLPSPM